MTIRTLGKDKRVYERVDIAPELQAVLNSNGMQAHIALGENGGYVLQTMAHNTSQPRSYKLTDDQLQKLVSGGYPTTNKEAYRTFVGIVKDDYYCPRSFTVARSVNSPVQMGQNGYRVDPREYGYGGFRPFHGRMFGPFDGYFHSQGFGPGHSNLRRIGNRLFVDNGMPVMAERPDGSLRPGELQSGSYGFYDKGNQASGNDVLTKIEVKPVLNELTDDEKKKMTLWDELFGKNAYNKHLYTGTNFNQMLSQHGIILDEKKKTLTIKAKGLDKSPEYLLTDKEMKVLFNEKMKLSTSKGKMINAKDGNTPGERLDIINNIIAKDFDGKVTPKMLNERDLVSLQFSEEGKKRLHAASQEAQQQAQAQQQAAKNDIIDLKNVREDYRSGFIDRWNSIGVVDGRALSEDRGFYLPLKGGRAVSVGEIQAYPANDGADRGQTFKMSAVINGKVFTHDISKEDYQRFLNYDDEHRLELFDKNFKEVQIKSARNGALQDKVVSDMLSNSSSAVSLKGNFGFLVDGQLTTITQATAWKDEVSGNYVLNVRDGKDAGMWTVKLTEQQYLAFKDAPQYEKAQMLVDLMPWKADLKGKVRVTPMSLYSESEKVNAAVNGDVPKLSDKLLSDLDKTPGLGYEPKETVKQEVEQAKQRKQEMQREGTYVEQGKRLVNGENLNLDDIRAETRINLTGQAAVNGESLDNLKDSKQWKRGGENGRDCTVGDIAVERMRGADGKPLEGKYIMSAVIDGVVVSHEINQKQYDKFIAVNDYQRMKLFDKVFPEVQMKTKEGHGFHLGAAILAAFTVGADIALSLGGPRPPRQRPEVYGSVFSKPGVVSPGAVAASLYEDKVPHDMDRAASVGMGRGL